MTYYNKNNCFISQLPIDQSATKTGHMKIGVFRHIAEMVGPLNSLRQCENPFEYRKTLEYVLAQYVQTNTRLFKKGIVLFN